MKTPFDALVLAQKKRLEAKELEILRTNNQIAAQYAKIDELQIALSQVIYPKEGDFSLFLKTNAQKKSLINDIDTHRTHISTLKAELKSLQEQRRIIYIEYEKYKHIQEREKEKIISELKRAESKNLDEIALLLYNNPIQKEMI
ncbi:flagellar export protein FliJ [Helicobacter sp. MIT 01-3238]|uniref:flagellar export protein FliJ n=1 Tax=Helicobacter sp. MIT 01-3238 TaxID=398627 RepID=UPI000E1F961E|nr:flagellar export protein FliJ [Helicobacter sp. MIT 01-3238]RDU51384.1 hypothetical protein CQA40_10300 [Helicobacter sp. MIT 01-3238]